MLRRDKGGEFMNLNKLALVGAVMASAFLLAACNKYGSSTSSTTTNQPAAQGTQSQDAITITITVTDNGFSPAESTVKSGGKVTWTNNSSKSVQVASDPHPTHTANPELTNGQSVAELAPGASVTVTLTKTGTWGFHDHLNPGVRGKVTVQ